MDARGGFGRAALLVALLLCAWIGDAAAEKVSAGGGGGTGNRIALLHMVDDVWFFQEMANVSRLNKLRYAARHGYDFVEHSAGAARSSGLWEVAHGGCGDVGDEHCRVDRHGRAHRRRAAPFSLDAQRAPTFGKLQLALEACVGRDDFWLLWTDADALVVNQSVALSDVVDDAFDLMLTEDWFMLNAGVLLLRCSPWSVAFLRKVYDDRSFDEARALDQSALDALLAALPEDERRRHVRYLPKHAINVYTEEYRPGDFIVHLAGKLYEATVEGATALMRQFDALSRQPDEESVAAFFRAPLLLNYFSGHTALNRSEFERVLTLPDGPEWHHPGRRLLLEPLGAVSSPQRYRHLTWKRSGFEQPQQPAPTPAWKDPNDPANASQ